MGDVMDILELDRNSNVDRKASIKKKRQLEPGFKKPEGMNREVYALLCSDNKDTPPLIPTDFCISSKLGFPGFGYKKVKANLSLRKVRKWNWIPFTNPARVDGFQLYHWRRDVDKLKEYPFAKMNVVANVPSYSDQEYHQWLQCDRWTKLETDYLFRMCRKYDLRFIIIEDRWDRSTYKNRSVEEIKDRYYSVCSNIAKHRTDPPSNDMGFANIKPQSYVFDIEHERKRKEQLNKLYNRTPEEVEEEQQLVAEMRKIEQRKKERDRKTQDLQKLITAADNTTEARRNEQHAASRSSTAMPRSNRKKTQSSNKGSRGGAGLSGVGDGSTASGTLSLESSSLKFPDLKAPGMYMRSSRMKLPTNIGQKRTKALQHGLNELKIELIPMSTEEIVPHFNELRNDLVLLYDLKQALATLEMDLQLLKLQAESTSTDTTKVNGTTTVTTTSVDVQSTTPNTPSTVTNSAKTETSADEPIKISELYEFPMPRKRKAALESENFMKKFSGRKSTN
ncbi:hypothetical protein RDWZM_002657 [Blomia tropicalis]|uniref:DNA methyltransferase 1-associated protein 1 n=1 Tax=Blomia tropicalis TaxID=40697 RepID=A0A9Q0MGR2_BLOTA|nr:DNA methyltransferase 1-associated protein 1 [Blomia tropicalis]KAJ6224112.1 hypothetical protein RDWZM_002657 [Blomia tropicalis]